MRYEVYCDESHPDVFWSRASTRARHLCIGSLWLPARMRAEVKGRIGELRTRHNVRSEAKWHKGHECRADFKNELSVRTKPGWDKTKCRWFARRVQRQKPLWVPYTW